MTMSNIPPAGSAAPLATPPTPAETPFQRVMAIYAHPDDPEFFSGGALATWAAAGKALIYVLATSGDKGSDDRTMTPARLVELREAEQRNAAKVMGSEQVIFLRHPDGELVADLHLRRELTRLLRLYKPDIVVTNDPQTYWFKSGGINHPDHRAIGEATLAAVYPAARDHLNFVELDRDEGLAPHKVRRVYLAGSQAPNVRIDISAVLETKIAAILEHKTQIKDAASLVKRQREAVDAEFDQADRYTESYRLLTLR